MTSSEDIEIGFVAKRHTERWEDVMPKTDYTDQEISFPRIEARVHKTDKDAYHIRIWIWDRPGDGRSGERREIMNGKRAGSYADITDMIYTCARENSVAVCPDDIIIDDH